MTSFFKSKYGKWILAGIGILLMGIAIFWWTQLPTETGVVHLHADFAVFINGEKINFAQEKYMSETATPLSSLVHFHDMDGNVIHMHAPHVTLGMFFESIGMKLETQKGENGIQQTCFTDDMDTEYCATRFGCYEYEPGKSICVDPGPEAQVLQVYINGELLPENQKMENYVLKDLDQILVTYHKLNEDVTSQIESVTDNACIQSEKCPERGKPTPEDSCAGSGECGVGEIA
jgi:hypothetical protein